jgi:hypothetical protein
MDMLDDGMPRRSDGDNRRRGCKNLRPERGWENDFDYDLLFWSCRGCVRINPEVPYIGYRIRKHVLATMRVADRGTAGYSSFLQQR